MALQWLTRLRHRILATRPYYQLDSDRMVAGDIILSTQKAALSLLIRIGTRSPFSHAAIYLGKGLYAEAVGIGVRVRSLSGCIKTHVKVFRLADNGCANPRLAGLKASEAVNSYINDPYSTKGALLSVYRKGVISERHRLFCSHLVAQAYKEAGVELIPHLHPTKVTPALLAKSKLLEDISNSVVSRIRLIPDFIVDSGFTTLSDRQTMIVQNMHADAADWFKEQNLPPPETWWHMLVALADEADASRRQLLDVALASVIVHQGYIELIRDAVVLVIKPMEQWLDDFPSMKIPNKQLAAEYYFMEEALTPLDLQSQIAEENRREYLLLYKGTSCKTFQLLALAAEAEHETAKRAYHLTTLMMNAIWNRFPAEWRQEARTAHERNLTSGASPATKTGFSEKP